MELNNGRFATYSSGSGGTTLTFLYTIAYGDFLGAADPLAPAFINSLQLNGGTISDLTAGTNPADLALPPGIGYPWCSEPRRHLGYHTPEAGSSSTPAGQRSRWSGRLPCPTTPSPSSPSRSHTRCRPSRSLHGDRPTARQEPLVASTTGLVYTLPVTATAPGVVQLYLDGTFAQDANGYPNQPGAGSVTYDITPPTLLITSNLGQVSPGADGPRSSRSSSANQSSASRQVPSPAPTELPRAP